MRPTSIGSRMPTTAVSKRRRQHLALRTLGTAELGERQAVSAGDLSARRWREERKAKMGSRQRWRLAVLPDDDRRMLFLHATGDRDLVGHRLGQGAVQDERKTEQENAYWILVPNNRLLLFVHLE